MRHYIIIKFLGLLILISALPAHCNGELWFRNLTIKDGLSGSDVECMIQDSRGFIWIGTREGLSVYNGYDFEPINNSSKPSTSKYITSLFEDKHGNIWVGYLSGGVCIYNFDQEKFSEVNVNNKIKTDFKELTVWDIKGDNEGNIWIATIGGLFKYSESSKEVSNEYYFNSRSGDKSNIFIRTLCIDSNNNLWIGTDDNGIKKYDATNDTFLELKNDAFNDNVLTNNRILSLYFDGDSTLWIGTENSGINALNIYTFTNHQIPLKDFYNKPIEGISITGFHKNSKDKIWISTENQGLKLYDIKNNSFTSYYHQDFNDRSLSSNSISCIMEDNFGIIWIGTHFSGVNYFYPYSSGFTLYKHVPFDESSPSNNNTRAFCEDSEKNVWVGTDGGGIDLYDKNMIKIKNINSTNAPFSFESNVSLSIIRDKYDNIWFGTWGDGIIKFNPKTGKFSQFQSNSKDINSLGSDFIVSMYCDDQNNIWVSCFKEGLTLISANTENITRIKSSDSDNSLSDTYYITRILKDSKGNLWLASGGNGLILKRGNVNYSYIHDSKNDNSLSSNIVHTIFEDSQGRIWLGTGNKLNLYNEQENNFTHFGLENGFINETIYSIQEDKKGSLWMGTSKGIICFCPDNDSLINYDYSYGLQENQFNANASILCQNGLMLFGGLSGFNSFDPENITVIKSKPIVQISNLLLFNEAQIPNSKNSPLTRHISNTNRVNLTYKQKVITIEYVGINYHNPNATEYAYILENFDYEWNYVDKKRSATYTNLKPGKYVFKVKAKTEEADWTYAKSNLEIYISPPFWKKPLALLIYFIVIFISLILLRTFIIKREQEKSVYKFEKYKVKKSEELDQLRMRFFTNISHELKTPLTLILAPIEQLIKIESDETKKYQYKTIQRNASRLLKLINQIMDLRKQQTGNLKLNLVHGDIGLFLQQLIESYTDMSLQRNIDLILENGPEKIVSAFDHDKLDKIVFNLLSNAFKYSSDGDRIIVKVSKDQNTHEVTLPGTEITTDEVISISVEDFGVGIDPEELSRIFERFYQGHSQSQQKQEGTGIGLSLSNDFAKLHGGKIEAINKTGKGSKFTLFLPFIANLSTENEKDSEAELQEDEIADHIDLQLDKEFKSASKSSLLIVEDNYDLREYLVNLLSQKYEVLAAENGSRGIEIAESKMPDIIIADIMMPEMNGIEMLKVLKRNIRTNHIPIILLTAKTSDTDRLMGLEEGADDYITKPFNIGLLETRITNLLEIRRTLKEKYIRHLKLDPKDVEIENEDEKFLRKALQVVEDNIENSEFSVEAFSLDMGLSRVHLYRKLNALIGESPVDFIKRIRLKRAAQLLTDSQMNVSEVCYAVGFKNTVYFTKCFKKEYHMLPSDFKKKE